MGLVLVLLNLLEDIWIYIDSWKKKFLTLLVKRMQFSSL